MGRTSDGGSANDAGVSVGVATAAARVAPVTEPGTAAEPIAGTTLNESAVAAAIATATNWRLGVKDVGDMVHPLGIERFHHEATFVLLTRQ